MLVGQLLFGEFVLELGVEHFLEYVLEPPVIDFDDRVLGRKVERITAIERVIHRGAGEIADRVVEIVHRHGDAAAGKLEDFAFDLLAVVADKSQVKLAFAWHAEIGGAILIAKGVTADDDWLGPSRHQAGHVLAEDRLAEDHPAENVADGAIRRSIHFVQVEFLHARFVRRDGGAFDRDADLFGGFGGIDRDLVARLVALFDAEVEIEQVDVEIREDQLFFDELPNDPGHLVPVHLDDGVGDFNFVHWRPFTCTEWIENGGPGGIGKAQPRRRASL